MNNKGSFEEITSGSSEEHSPESTRQTEDLPSANDSSLEALVNQEEALARRSLQKELGRDPTLEEINEWINAHTESY